MTLSVHTKNSMLKLYYDDISPPVRSVLMVMEELNLMNKTNLIYIDLFKGKHLTEEYIKVGTRTKIKYFVVKLIIWTETCILYSISTAKHSHEVFPSM